MLKLSDAELLLLPPRKLVAIIRQLERVIREQGGVMERLEKRVAALEAELRESKSSKAPFSKGKRKEDPKRPGRRPGQGRFSRREEPQADPGDVVEQIDVPLDESQPRQCPRCKSALEIAEETATIEDTPPQPTRVIKRFRVEVGRCLKCGFQIRGRHPELRAGQSGANAHQLGVRVSALAFALHYHDGMPLRRVPEVIDRMTGIRLTQSALTQSAGKLCEEGGLLYGQYEGLRERIAASIAVNTDDTGWRVAAMLAFLMGFFTSDTALFQVRMRHRHQEVLEVLGEDFKGMLGTDRGTSYEAWALDDIAMQKCLSHLMKNLSVVEATKSGRAKAFTSKLKATLREALELWHAWREGRISLATYRRRGGKLKRSLSDQLRDRTLSDADNQRLLDGIGYQHDRGRLTLFLDHPEIEPTNNRAERGLRPAVIARKVSHCSKNARGAHTYSVMKSVFATLALRTKDVVGAFADLLAGESLEVACKR